LRDGAYALSGGFRDELDLTRLRNLLREMSDDDLRRFGKAADYMCSSESNLGQISQDATVVQDREAREEWRRRRLRDLS
jgi:hypothetical protein